MLIIQFSSMEDFLLMIYTFLSILHDQKASNEPNRIQICDKNLQNNF